MLKRLGKYELHVRYLTILLLIAFEPEQELKLQVKQFFGRVVPQLRKQNIPSFLPEFLLARLIHLLAHHPDFSSDLADVKLCAKYIAFFLDLVANPENVAFLYHIASRIKTTKDAMEANENIYILSDVAQQLIHDRCAHHGWSLPTYPGKIDLPRNLFEPITDENMVRSILMRNYLPAGFVKPKRSQGLPKAERKTRARVDMDVDENEEDAGKSDDEFTEVLPVSKRARGAPK